MVVPLDPLLHLLYQVVYLPDPELLPRNLLLEFFFIQVLQPVFELVVLLVEEDLGFFHLVGYFVQLLLETFDFLNQSESFFGVLLADLLKIRQEFHFEFNFLFDLLFLFFGINAFEDVFGKVGHCLGIEFILLIHFEELELLFVIFDVVVSIKSLLNEVIDLFSEVAALVVQV